MGKLTLSKETLRVLADDQLDDAAGASGFCQQTGLCNQTGNCQLSGAACAQTIGCVNSLGCFG